MKKKGLLVTVAVLLLTVFMFACSEAGPPRRSATAIGIGYDDNVTEVFIVVDAYGGVSHVAFDEIFNVHYGSQMTKAVYEGDTIPESAKFMVAGSRSSYHYKYISVGGKLFEGKAEGGTSVYTEISDSADKITDLRAHCGKPENVEWYYNAYKNSQLKNLTPSTSETAPITINGQKFTAGNMTTTYGSMRKSRSTYWGSQNSSNGTGLLWKGNMEAFANFLYAHGFDGMEFLSEFDNPEKLEEMNQKMKVIDGYVSIDNGQGFITSGATLSPFAYLYFGTAYRAYTQAVNNM